uniref:Solute carrier family 6 member 18 n=1 Tax=Suricata suricatta TaxID=37032 RepID=A0A673SXD6_SURSU
MACAQGPDPLGAGGGGERRPRWDNRLQYLLSCIGFAVGLGNIWRFPYLCQTYGGGLGCLTVSFLVSLYYNTVLTWVLWYFLNSFQSPLPWGSCPLDLNRTGLEAECQASSPVSYFWYRQTLNITADISDSGSVQGRLLACLAAAWAIVYLCVIRGIESTGKAIYFTALFPYLVLTVFLIRGLTLPGAVRGLTYLFTPDVQVLRSPRVWLDAATQIFFSLSLAFGGHIAFASYNPPRNNCEKDAVTIALVNSMTSLYASIAMFSVLGFKAANDHGRCLDRNILQLINAFDLPDQSVSRDDYAAVLTHLNATQPDRVARLCLETCRLEDFLDKVPEGPQTVSTGLGLTGLWAVSKGHRAGPVPRLGSVSRKPVASDAICLTGTAGQGPGRPRTPAVSGTQGPGHVVGSPIRRQLSPVPRGLQSPTSCAVLKGERSSPSGAHLWPVVRPERVGPLLSLRGVSPLCHRLGLAGACHSASARVPVLQSASGTGLAFIIFTEAILHMPGAPGWAVLFFGMLFTLGLSSMFGNMESIITPLLDVGLVHRSVPKEVLSGLVCLVCFLSATCFTLQSGNYWLEIFDNYVAPLDLMVLAFFEVVGVAYVYGVQRFGDDIECMTGRRPGLYWRVTWRVVSPLLLLTIFVAYVAVLAWTPLSYRAWDAQYVRFPLRQEKSYPGWVQATCVLLCFLPTLWVPAVALVQLLAECRRRKDGWQARNPVLCVEHLDCEQGLL